jgi:peroxiredoxin
MMTLTPGQTMDLGVLYRIDENNIHASVNVSVLFANKRVLVFMGPAPFSRLDTQQANEYESLSSEILKQSIDDIFGIYVQDAFVMHKFQEQIRQQAGSANVKFYGDGDGFFVKANNLMHDFTYEGLSTRCGRWAFILNNCVIEHVIVDDYSLLDKTSANSILKYLKNET